MWKCCGIIKQRTLGDGDWESYGEWGAVQSDPVPNTANQNRRRCESRSIVEEHYTRLFGPDQKYDLIAKLSETMILQ